MRTRTSGQGRPRGAQNRMSADVKAMILGALDELGGQDYLVTQARENPTAFLSLVGKILPKEIKADVAATHVIRSLTPEQQRGIAEAILNR